MRRREVDEMPKCASCGILIPSRKHEVVKEHHGRQIIFSSEKCYQVYLTYWYPKYGQVADGETTEKGEANATLTSY